MVRRVLSFAVLGTLALAGVASAGTKITPALSKSSTDVFVCRVLNGSTGPINAQVEIIGSNGALLKQEILTNPGGWTGSAIYTGTAPIGYCKVSGSFSRSKTMVTLCITKSGSNLCEVAVGDPGL